MKFNLSIDIFAEEMKAADVRGALASITDQVANAAAREITTTQPWSPYALSGKIYGAHKRVIGTWRVDPEVSGSLTISAENGPDSRVHCASCGEHVKKPMCSTCSGVPGDNGVAGCGNCTGPTFCTTCMPKTATAIDRRRLTDGWRALTLPEPQTPDAIRTQLPIILDGMLALQSLDDLGEESNRRALKNFSKLTKRYAALKARLGVGQPR